jgi:hypothetical protein
MRTVHITMASHLTPERVLAAVYDFSARRAELFPAVSTDHLEIHELGSKSADVTEGTATGIGVNWERCHHDWRPRIWSLREWSTRMSTHREAVAGCFARQRIRREAESK